MLHGNPDQTSYVLLAKQCNIEVAHNSDDILYLYKPERQTIKANNQNAEKSPIAGSSNHSARSATSATGSFFSCYLPQWINP